MQNFLEPSQEDDTKMADILAKALESKFKSDLQIEAFSEDTDKQQIFEQV